MKRTVMAIIEVEDSVNNGQVRAQSTVRVMETHSIKQQKA